MREAGLEEFKEADAIGIIDRFALQYRMRDGRTVVDRFVASLPDLDAADREMLLGWRDPVEGIFEVRGQAWRYHPLNLIDDLEYRTYLRHGPGGLPADREESHGGLLGAAITGSPRTGGARWPPRPSCGRHRPGGAGQAGPLAISAAGRTWVLPIVGSPFTGPQLLIPLPTKNQALQLQHILASSG